MNELHHATQAVITFDNINKQVFVDKNLAITTAIIKFSAFISGEQLFRLFKANQLLLTHLFNQQMNHTLNLSRLNLGLLEVQNRHPEFRGG